MIKTAALLTAFSGFGKCTVSLSLPVLSMCRVAASVVPTCVLSSHMGGLGTPDKVDMTEHIDLYTDQWKSIGVHFDAIGIGSLSAAQGDKIKRFISELANDDTIVLVDPVMADNGRFYTGFSDEHVKQLRELCPLARVITPNYTEGCLLTGTEYTQFPDDGQIEEVCTKLSLMCSADVVLTGILRDDKVMTAVMSKDKEYRTFIIPRIQGHFHGCGDLFSACLLASLLGGKDIFSAAEKSSHFVSLCIAETAKEKSDERFGLAFEKCLPNIQSTLEI